MPRKNRSVAGGAARQIAAMTFHILGLPAAPFTELFTLSDTELAARGAVRVIAEAGSGYPCRISLTDAEPGQAVILVHFEHHPVASPYRASHAIYVRDGETTYDAVDQVPDQLRKRLLSVRAFDRAGMMLAADIVEGRELEGLIARLFADDRAAYLHAHYARQGCYAARIERG